MMYINLRHFSSNVVVGWSLNIERRAKEFRRERAEELAEKRFRKWE